MNEINFDTLKSLIKIVEKRIKLINANIASNQEQLQRVNEYDELIETINNDNQCFVNDSFTAKLDNLLGGIEIVDRTKLEALLEKLSYLDVVARGIIDGFYKNYNEQELSTINEVIELIQYFKTLSHDQKSEQRSNVTKSNQELERCEALYDKLRNGKDGVEHLDSDIPYLMMLLKDEDIKFRREVLLLVQSLSKCIHENILRQIGEDELTAIGGELEYEEENQEEIDDDLIRGVFAKYGFNYDFLTDKHKNALTKISLRRIEGVLQVLSSYEEYQFVRNYQKYGNERALFLILRHATKETLEYLVEDAKKRDVLVEEIFGVNGVYKKVSKNKEGEDGPPGPGGDPDDEYLAGSYEYYRKNADYFEKLSLKFNANNPDKHVDFFKDILLTAPEVLAVPSHLVAENVELAMQYGIKIVSDTVMGECHAHTPTMYESRHFAELSDVLIENGLEDYLVRYPSVLRDEKFVRKILYYKAMGKLERTPNGKIRDVRFAPEPHNLDQVVNRNNLDKYISRVPVEIIEFVNNSDNKKLLSKLKEDSVMTSMDNHPEVQLKKDSMYVIDGVIVSRHKFRRIWYLMTMSGHMNKSELSNLLMYALIYDSYYNEQELEVLEKFAYGFNFGGYTLWNI